MNEYIQISFRDLSIDQTEILIAELSLIGFSGFQEDEQILKAFIPGHDFDQQAVEEIAKRNAAAYTMDTIQETNWNAVWESNFEPVIVDDFAAIRASFHKPIKGVEHEIIITPKMSFGTGHHSTTFMMMRQMRQLDFADKKIFDFGTGTGILAILAEKSGAGSIVAIDNDDWSISNAQENIGQNNCSRIELRKADTAAIAGSFDIILANINKNVILDNFHLLTSRLVKKGILLLSGLLEDDENDIVERGAAAGLKLTGKFLHTKWICLQFEYE